MKSAYITTKEHTITISFFNFLAYITTAGWYSGFVVKMRIPFASFSPTKHVVKVFLPLFRNISHSVGWLDTSGIQRAKSHGNNSKFKKKKKSQAYKHYF